MGIDVLYPLLGALWVLFKQVQSSSIKFMRITMFYLVNKYFLLTIMVILRKWFNKEILKKSLH